MSNDSNYFSTQLAKILTATGKSQKEVSIQTDISETKLSKLLSGRMKPQYEDILKISEVLKVSPSFFFNTDTKFSPVDIGYILGTRVYSILYNNPKEGAFVLIGRAFDSGSFIPIQSLPFLKHLRDDAVFSITLIKGEIKVGDKELVKGISAVLDGISEIHFEIGAIYLLQIVGMTEKFAEMMKNYLPSEKSINF
ncbi:MAG: helix-turn-helix transcriptional regulator [Bacteroidota bacterium]